jgi:hypothetical protein
MFNLARTFALLLSLCLPLAACAGEADRPEPKPFRTVGIPDREHGYDNLKSTVVRTKAEFEALLKEVADQGTWNNKKAFVDALKGATIDFDKEALVLLRHTEGSGSVQVTFEAPGFKDGTITCSITRKEPPVGTADMAYYCFALAVSKADVKEVVLKVGEKETAKLKVQ